MKTSLQWLFAAALALLAALVLFRTYTRRHSDPDQDEEEETVKMPSRVSAINGQTVITFDRVTERAMGIAVVKLRAVEARREEPAAARVLSTQTLVTLRNNIIAARAAIAKAQAQLTVSSREYARLQALYKENHNISERALEAAHGATEVDRAALRAAKSELEIAGSATRQTWGGVVAVWMTNDSGALERLLSQDAVLIQLTLPPDASREDPPEIALSTPSGLRIDARYLSPFPQIDPRIQGVSELYLASAYPALEPGMNLIAHLPVGRRMRGVLIPRSAIVWWQGSAWVYEETGPGRFTRRAVQVDQPAVDGYISTQGFKPGTKVVTQGTQALLSEEFRAQIQPED